MACTWSKEDGNASSKGGRRTSMRRCRRWSLRPLLPCTLFYGSLHQTQPIGSLPLSLTDCFSGHISKTMQMEHTYGHSKMERTGQIKGHTANKHLLFNFAKERGTPVFSFWLWRRERYPCGDASLVSGKNVSSNECC